MRKTPRLRDGIKEQTLEKSQQRVEEMLPDGKRDFLLKLPTSRYSNRLLKKTEKGKCAHVSLHLALSRFREKYFCSKRQKAMNEKIFLLTSL